MTTQSPTTSNVTTNVSPRAQAASKQGKPALGKLAGHAVPSLLVGDLLRASLPIVNMQTPNLIDILSRNDA